MGGLDASKGFVLQRPILRFGARFCAAVSGLIAQGAVTSEAAFGRRAANQPASPAPDRPAHFPQQSASSASPSPR